ncbi:MAG: hypothetical protein V4490_01605, partial [Pseudomonadota bacterium]
IQANEPAFDTYQNLMILINKVSNAYRALLLMPTESSQNAPYNERSELLRRIETAATKISSLKSAFDMDRIGCASGQGHQKLFFELAEQLTQVEPAEINVGNLFLADVHLQWDYIYYEYDPFDRIDTVRQFEKEHVAEILEMLRQGISWQAPAVKARLLGLYHYTALTIEELYPYTNDFQSKFSGRIEPQEQRTFTGQNISIESLNITQNAFNSLESCLSNLGYILRNSDMEHEKVVEKINELNHMIPDQNMNWGKYELERRAMDGMLAQVNAEKERLEPLDKELRKLKEENEKLSSEIERRWDKRLSKTFRILIRVFVKLFCLGLNFFKKIFGVSVDKDRVPINKTQEEVKISAGFDGSPEKIDVMPRITQNTGVGFSESDKVNIYESEPKNSPSKVTAFSV